MNSELKEMIQGIDKHAKGTPKSLLEAIDNGLMTEFDYTRCLKEVVHEHVKDFLAQRLQVSIIHAGDDMHAKLVVIALAQSLGFKI